jgi:hypothetical protein
MVSNSRRPTVPKKQPGVDPRPIPISPWARFNQTLARRYSNKPSHKAAPLAKPEATPYPAALNKTANLPLTKRSQREMLYDQALSQASAHGPGWMTRRFFERKRFSDHVLSE